MKGKIGAIAGLLLGSRTYTIDVKAFAFIYAGRNPMGRNSIF